jgi:outer membrane protein assembly factor BamB
VQSHEARSAAGTFSTNGGLVFVGEDGGDFIALDAKTGKPLWHFPVNHSFRASPMIIWWAASNTSRLQGRTAF